MTSTQYSLSQWLLSESCNTGTTALMFVAMVKAIKNMCDLKFGQPTGNKLIESFLPEQ